MEKNEIPWEINSFTTKVEASDYFNRLLSEAHRKELNFRKGLQRPFKVTDDINSNPYCDVFKGKRVNIIGSPEYVATTNDIRVGESVINHTFFINSKGEIIDPTFGQHLIKNGVDPVAFRDKNKDLFVNGIFYGRSSDVKKAFIDYFPKKIKR